MTIEYIAHPLSGDIKNVDKVLHICRLISMTEPDVVPFAHWVVEAMSLNDQVPEEREIGIRHDHEIIDRLKFDACRLYGDRISAGMKAEIKIFIKMGIMVKPMTQGTYRDFMSLLNELAFEVVRPENWEPTIRYIKEHFNPKHPIFQ